MKYSFVYRVEKGGVSSGWSKNNMDCWGEQVKALILILLLE